MKTMLKAKNYISGIVMSMGLLILGACSNALDEPLENVQLEAKIDFSKSEDMVLMLYGAYAEFNDLQWETFPIIAVRGDDVNAAGDQFPLQQTDLFNYDRNFWMYNSTWLNLYTDILYFQGALEAIDNYKAAGANETEAEQYKAEIKVLRGFELLQLARLWGSILIPSTSQPRDLFNVPLSSFEEVMQHISDQMDEALPFLSSVRPGERTDVPGGATRYTALVIKALANLELKNYQNVADATGEIIGSNQFNLAADFYNLFKIPGKLSEENLLELQYSDFGTSSGTRTRYLWDFFGPSDWTPAVSGSGGGWGFWEPSVKYSKFMLARGERTRLETAVINTPDGIDSLQNDPDISSLPSWVSNITPDGDVFNDHPRYNYMSGKHYLPSTQLTPGRTEYGENKNFICIRYAEVLLMHAEALVSGASSSVLSADEAVNIVRARAGLTSVSGVTLDDVLDEKYAEFAMEWGTRFYDLVRHNRTAELNYGGRVYDPENDRFLPYPLEQQDILPQLKEASKSN